MEQSFPVPVTSNLAIPVLHKTLTMLSNTLAQTVEQFWGQQPHSVFADTIRKAVQYGSTEYGAEEALIWANGFTFGHNAATHDEKEWQKYSDGTLDIVSLQALIKARQEQALPSRLNHDRLNSWDPDDPDLQLLRDLVHGMPILVDPDFVPVSTPPPMRASYRYVAPAVNKLLSAVHASGGALLLPTNILRGVSGVNFVPPHWTTKKMKPQGRACLDTSCTDNGVPLNTPNVREQVRAKWGKICLPTLQDIIDMILEVGVAHGFQNIVLWKLDLANAFALLFVNPESAPLLTVELTEGVSLLYFTGVFGWTGSGFAFDVLSRSIKRYAQLRITGKMTAYVDDFVGVSLNSDATNDISLVSEAATRLLGPTAVAHDKTSCSRKEDIIGWTVDLDQLVVSMSERNALKMLYGFASCDTNKPSQLHQVQKLSSWAYRATQVCPGMKPFLSGLNAMLKGHSRPCSTLEWTSTAKLHVTLWTAYICMLVSEPKRFARSIFSFESHEPWIAIQTDASLFGLGMAIGPGSPENPITRRPDIQEGRHSRLFHCNFGPYTDSSMQNTAEFVAMVLGCALTIGQQQTKMSIKIFGDNTTALEWMRKGAAKSDRAFPATLVLTHLHLRFGQIEIATEHVAGTDNSLCDNISRLSTEIDFPEIRSRVIEPPPWLVSLAEACTPLEEEDFEPTPDIVSKLWERARAAVGKIPNSH